MKVIKVMKIIKRTRIAKDKFDLKQRGYTDSQYLGSGSHQIAQYLKAEDEAILKGITE